MNIFEDLIVPYNEQLIGFFFEQVNTREYLDLRMRIETRQDNREIQIWYLLVEANTSYNVLLDLPFLNTFEAIVSTPH